jgi:4-alpha-glucanotransferase
MKEFMKRAAGIFLHPTSLPSRFGIGDLGESARRWIDLLADNRQRLWQVCPLGPTGYGDSPYQSLCSFAGNTLIIAPTFLDGLLTDSELAEFPHLPDDAVDYGRVITEKENLFLKAYGRFRDTSEFTAFCERERMWLDDFALFAIIKARHGGRAWIEWESPFKLRCPDALKELRETEHNAIRYQKFLQFFFCRQWTNLREYAKSKKVLIIGDMPYYVAGDSSDTWSAPHLFELDEQGNPLRLAGVPPDYFSDTGQLWGNPLYRWDIMRRDCYAWWIRRIRKSLEFVDYLRLDHFRGFDSYWAVPAGSTSAAKGTWEEGPGEELFTAIRNNLGKAPLIAEDLGDITPRVEELRRRTCLPGMKVLQFAFDGDPDNSYLPSNVNADSIMYSGTHDNDTSCGWFASLSRSRHAYVCRYLGCRKTSFINRFLRLAYMSPSRFCIIPLQDILGLPSKDRMNTPGSECGNWRWRVQKEYLQEKYFATAADFTEVYGRAV